MTSSPGVTWEDGGRQSKWVAQICQLAPLASSCSRKSCRSVASLHWRHGRIDLQLQHEEGANAFWITTILASQVATIFRAIRTTPTVFFWFCDTSHSLQAQRRSLRRRTLRSRVVARHGQADLFMQSKITAASRSTFRQSSRSWGRRSSAQKTRAMRPSRLWKMNLPPRPQRGARPRRRAIQRTARPMGDPNGGQEVTAGFTRIYY